MTATSTAAAPQTQSGASQTTSTKPPVCEHLTVANEEEELPFHRWYLGTGLDCEILCPPCIERKANGEQIPTRRISDAQFAEVIDAFGKEGGHIGDPEVINRPKPVDAKLVATELAADVSDIAVARNVPLTTFVLTPEGQVIQLNHANNTAVSCGYVSMAPAITPAGAKRPVRRPRLHVSSDGRYAAVVTDFGQSGSVINIATGQVTMRLDGDQETIDSVPFSLAFCDYQGQTVLVHRTAWNRLDVSNPADGTLLTARTVPAFVEGDEDDGKKLDYFHGALFVSPNGTNLLNDGWNWEPVGRPVVWSVEEWLTSNVWESEVGRTKLTVPHQNHYWNQGFCWIGDRHVAVEGIGHPDDEMIPGVRIFDVSPNGDEDKMAREAIAFAGPMGRLFADGDQLFSADEDGLAIWSISERALTGRISGFSPTAQSVIDRTLIDAKNDSIRRWSY